MLKHGADAYLSDDTAISKSVILELAKLKLQNQSVWKENLKNLCNNPILRIIYKECLEELEELKVCKLYGNFLLYNILFMREERKR